MMALQTQHSRLVRTRDGMVCQCNESVWMDSPLLRSSAARDSRPFKVDCNKDTWFDLEVAHREGKFPIDLLDLYRLLAVAVQLELRNLIRQCLRHLLAAPDFWKYQFPKDTPDEVLLLYVKETLKCLFRTPEVYRHAVDEILSLSRGLKLTETFLNEFNSKLRDFTELGLERVPISFHIPCVPIVLAKQQGDLRTAIYIEKSLLWCDLFGKNLDLSTFNTNSFHIKYASYVLYKSAQKVYYKDLRSRTTVRRVLRNCEFFISRKYTVLAVTHEYSESRVWMWVENEEYGGKFKVIHASPDEIKCVDFEPEGTFLITKKDGSLLTAVLGPHRLIIITEHRGEFVYAFFHDQNMYAFSLKEGKKIAFNVHSFWRVAPSQWVECKGFHGRRALEEFAEDGGVFPLGGELFRLSKRGLEVKPPGDSPFLLLRPGEFVGVSELHLHP